MSIPESTTGTTSHRYESYRDFRFRVKWEGSYVAGFTKVGGFGTHVIDHRSGADPASGRGQSDYSPVSLERGVSYDLAFQQWANKLWYYSNAGKVPGNSNPLPPLQDFRKDIVVEIYNEAGQHVIAYTIHNCWVSEFDSVPELDSIGNALAIQTVVLQHEGWEVRRA